MASLVYTLSLILQYFIIVVVMSKCRIARKRPLISKRERKKHFEMSVTTDAFQRIHKFIVWLLDGATYINRVIMSGPPGVADYPKTDPWSCARYQDHNVTSIYVEIKRKQRNMLTYIAFAAMKRSVISKWRPTSKNYVRTIRLYSSLQYNLVYAT